MFDIGFQELVIIFVVALLVFGPKQLPELAKTMGKWMAEIKRGIYIAKGQIENELSTDYKLPDADIINSLPKDEQKDAHHVPPGSEVAKQEDKS